MVVTNSTAKLKSLKTPLKSTNVKLRASPRARLSSPVQNLCLIAK